MGLNILKQIVKMSLELLGLLLELLLELLLLLLYAFYHELVLRREAPPCNYVINAYSRSSSSSSSSSNSSPSSSMDILVIFAKCSDPSTLRLMTAIFYRPRISDNAVTLLKNVEKHTEILTFRILNAALRTPKMPSLNKAKKYRHFQHW